MYICKGVQQHSEKNIVIMHLKTKMYTIELMFSIISLDVS